MLLQHPLPCALLHDGGRAGGEAAMHCKIGPVCIYHLVLHSKSAAEAHTYQSLPN